MERVKTFLMSVVTAGVVLVAAVFGVHYGVQQIDKATLDWLATAAVFVIIVLVPLSYYFGHSEARGFLAGADRMFDGTMGKAIDAMDRRETLKRQREMENSMARQQVPMQPYFPVEITGDPEPNFTQTDYGSRL